MEAPKVGKSPPSKNALEDGTDVWKLCEAIAFHETKSGKHTIAKNNWHNIMTWDRGYREGKSYASPEESQKDCVRIWRTYYKKFPDYQLADRYTGGDNVWGWLATVKQKYTE